MLELGKYAGAILGSWGITLGLLGLLVALTWVQARSAKRKHDEIEARRQDGSRAENQAGDRAGEGSK